jgi:hypothetical protein
VTLVSGELSGVGIIERLGTTVQDAQPSTPTEPTPPRLFKVAAEVLLIFLVFFLHAGWPAPDLNEAHYLAKAKHFWNPSWCGNDAFLDSADAHWVFYWTFGWLTKLLPLPQVAWLGRVVIWLLLAASWRSLSFAVVPLRGFSVLSAGLAVCLWSRCHMAGEWVIGGVEAKCVAYVFVFLALRRLVGGNWRGTWLLLGAASAFHVLVGGWSVVAAGIAWLVLGRSQRPSLRSMIPALVGGLLLALPGLIPVLRLDWAAAPDLTWTAHRIYVFRRLAHHLVLHEYPPLFIGRHVAMLIAWGGLSWWIYRTDLAYRRLSAFVVGVVSIALTGAVIDVWTIANEYWGGFWLRFYWFRLSDAILPVALALAAGVWVQTWQARRPVAARWLLMALIVTASVSLADHVLRRRLDPRPGADIQGQVPVTLGTQAARDVYADWRDVCRWIRTSTPPEVCFLTPRDQQTFKWYAQRSEVVNWKDVPQNAAGVVDWWSRFGQVRTLEDPTLTPLEFRQRVLDLARQYDFQYVLVARANSPPQTGLPLVYTNRSFAVYRVQRMKVAG